MRTNCIQNTKKSIRHALFITGDHRLSPVESVLLLNQNEIALGPDQDLTSELRGQHYFEADCIGDLCTCTPGAMQMV